MSRAGGFLAALVGVVVGATALPASAQSNLDAGKSPAQIFAHTCNACHRSPREIKKTTPAFMREHYTTGMQEATAMAAYLSQVGTDPKAVEQRRKPALGAGRETPPGEQKPSGDTQTAAANGPAGAKPAQPSRTRRPAGSVETGTVMAAASAAPGPAPTTTTTTTTASAPAAPPEAPAAAPAPAPAQAPAAAPAPAPPPLPAAAGFEE